MSNVNYSNNEIIILAEGEEGRDMQNTISSLLFGESLLG